MEPLLRLNEDSLMLSNKQSFKKINVIGKFSDDPTEGEWRVSPSLSKGCRAKDLALD